MLNSVIDMNFQSLFYFRAVQTEGTAFSKLPRSCSFPHRPSVSTSSGLKQSWMLRC